MMECSVHPEELVCRRGGASSSFIRAEEKEHNECCAH